MENRGAKLSNFVQERVTVEYNEVWKQTEMFGVDTVNCRIQRLQQQNVLGDRCTRDRNDAIRQAIVGHVTR
jgi:hypothetical protein